MTDANNSDLTQTQQTGHSQGDNLTSNDDVERRKVGSDQDSSNTFTDPEELIGSQEVVNINSGDLMNLSTAQSHGIAAVTDCNGAVYLLVANDNNTTSAPNENISQTTCNSQETNVNVISQGSVKGITPTSNSRLQIMNTAGMPVNINVNDLIATLNGGVPLKSDTSPTTTQNINVNDILTTVNISSIGSSHMTGGDHSTITGVRGGAAQPNDSYIIGATSGGSKISNIPNWALYLRDCTLHGDTFTGYVRDEGEMDTVLNLYKKETQSLFAIRQTPSPSKEEGADTVRLMWKSQYVPYDGIPFVNIGRRATVMECEYGPRKKNNALKRMIQLHGQEHSLSKVPILTCPARLFVKKVLKFPQFQVPSDSDPKVLRQLQEQSLKHVREHGFQTGEIRLYMQLPLPCAHRYHHVGTSLDPVNKEVENYNNDPISDYHHYIDSRVLAKIQQIVRQGFVNPFLVRAATKDFVENQMKLRSFEQVPFKHNKQFYPPLIEIQNIIQQTQAALHSGMTTPLPAPSLPPIVPKVKRKRSASEEAVNSPLIIKRTGHDKHSDGMVSPTIPSQNIGSVSHTRTVMNDSLLPEADAETISLTLTDNQLENFSVSNFTYNQLAQLAKIGLLALNNAAKDTTQIITEDITLKTECDKGVGLINSPLPDCISHEPVLGPVPCDEAGRTKMGILSGINDNNGLGSPSRLTDVDVVR